MSRGHRKCNDGPNLALGTLFKFLWSTVSLPALLGLLQAHPWVHPHQELETPGLLCCSHGALYLPGGLEAGRRPCAGLAPYHTTITPFPWMTSWSSPSLRGGQVRHGVVMNCVEMHRSLLHIEWGADLGLNSISFWCNTHNRIVPKVQTPPTVSATPGRLNQTCNTCNVYVSNVLCYIMTLWFRADVHMQQRALWVSAAAPDATARSGGGGEI